MGLRSKKVKRHIKDDWDLHDPSQPPLKGLTILITDWFERSTPKRRIVGQHLPCGRAE
jgi:hypothetical protein